MSDDYPVLQYLAAKFVLEMANADEIIQAVDELLAEGVYVDAFLDITDAEPRNALTIAPHFKKMLQQLNMTLPDVEAAIWAVAKHHIVQIVTEPSQVFTALDQLIGILDSYFQQHTGGNYAANYKYFSLFLFWKMKCTYDTLATGHTISYNDQYGQAALDALKQDVTLEASRWLNGYFMHFDLPMRQG